MTVVSAPGSDSNPTRFVVRRCGERLVPRLYRHLNPMTYEEAAAAEPRLAEELRQRGFLVYGGH